MTVLQECFFQPSCQRLRLGISGLPRDSRTLTVFLATLFLILLSLSLSPVCGQSEVAYPSVRHGGNYMINFYLPPAPSSTPWTPCWSPDGRWVAASMSGSIWKIDPDSGRAWELTYNDKYHSSPDWSPDGKWIIYTADDGGRTIQLEILNTETGESRSLTDDSFVYADPTFSPDGSRIAYVSTEPSGYYNVYVRPIRDGKWSGPAIPVTRDREHGNDRLYFGSWDMHLSPAWTPDGEELLIVSNRDTALGSGPVWRLPVRRNGMEEARKILDEQTLYRTRPDVSPDGRRFVYSSTRGAADQFNNLYVQPTEGGFPYKLTFFSHDAFHPRWSPDGERIVFISNAGGLPQLGLLETYGGSQRRVEISERRWKRPVGILSVNVRDEHSRETAARLHLRASDGKFYVPPSSYARVAELGKYPLFHASGSFRLELPVGKTRLTFVKGFEFRPVEVEAEIVEGKVSFVEIELKPMTDMAAKGWYSGSTHVHMNYGGNFRNTPENLIFMSEAEDQDVVNEQIANKDNRILDYQYFIPGGEAHPLSDADHLLVIGQEYRPPFYGHVFMLGLRDHLISPFTTGYESTAIESLYPSNTDMLRKARAQGATVGYVHAFAGESDPLKGSLGVGKGFMVDAALGTIDALEWSNPSRAGFYPLYAAWNNDLRITAVGGEDSISDLHRSKLVGSMRTYVFTGEKGLDMDEWFESLRRGRAFVTNGPLLDFAVEGRIPGDTIHLPEGGGVLHLKISVESIAPLDQGRLIFNGNVLEEVPFTGNRHNLEYEKAVEVVESGWLHFRVSGLPGQQFPLDATYAQAFTNPVWVEVGDVPIRSSTAADYGLLWIDKLQEMAEQWFGWRSQAEQDHVFAQFEEARKVYRSLLGDTGRR